MLIKETYHDVATQAGGKHGTMRIYVIEPNVPEWPEAKFPGVVVFSEIYQVTGPVRRFASNIASQGYTVACPSSFHEFVGPEPIAYDTKGTDDGNRFKAEKTVEAYDEDCTLSIDLLSNLASCNGRIAATGMCLGGHLALRAAFDPRVLATFGYFATDIHSASLGANGGDDTLARITRGDMTHKGEVALVFGKQDTHVPRAGRDLIRKTLEDAEVELDWIEVQAQHAFIRDESSKGRWDAALSRGLFGMMMELFERRVARDLGPRKRATGEVEHVC